MTELQVGVRALEKNKGGTVLAACVQVKRMEEKGDALYHEWLGRLFEGQPDPLDVIKSPSGPALTLPRFPQAARVSRFPSTASV